MTGKYFGQFEEGDTYTSQWKYLGESHFHRFCDLAGLREPLFESRGHADEDDRWLIPGFMTVSMAAGLFSQSGWTHETSLALLEVGGIAWENPVFAGDEFRIRVEVVDTVPTSSDRGGVTELAWEGENRDGETVLEMSTKHFIEKRSEE